MMAPMSERVVYVHLGSPKTGTTFLQAMLHQHRRRLREDGVFYPPTLRGGAHHGPAHDVRAVQWHGYRPSGVQGSWDRLVRTIHDWQEPGVVVVSSELFAFATREQAERAVASLRPAEVHLVLTARDLVRQVPAVWQERVKNRSPLTYEEFVQQLVDEEVPWQRGPWCGQEPATILERWGGSVPPERVHLVTVPPKGADPTVLWTRFASLLGVDPDSYPPVKTGANTSLGVAETEAVRRLNVQLQEVPWPFYGRHVKNGIAQGVLAGRSDGDRLVLPEWVLPWVEQRSKQIIDSVSGRGYDIVGDLDDLLPPADGAGVGPVPQPDPERLAWASGVAADYLARRFARAWRRWNQPEPEPAPAAHAGPVRARLGRLADRHRAVHVLRRGYRATRRRVRR
jgi:hypothetical protein